MQNLSQKSAITTKRCKLCERKCNNYKVVQALSQKVIIITKWSIG